MKKIIVGALFVLLSSIPTHAQISSYLDSFVWTNTDAVNTTYARNGYGFKPKLAFIWISANSSGSDGISAGNFAGAFSWVAETSPGTIERRTSSVFTTESEHDGGSSSFRNDTVISFTGSISQHGLDVASMDTDGITFIVDNQNAAYPTVRVFVLAIAGADITDIAMGDAVSPTSTGTQSVSVAFQPTVVFLLNFGGTAAPNTYAGYQGYHEQWSPLSIGIATDSSHQFTTSFFNERGFEITSSASYATSGDALVILRQNGSTSFESGSSVLYQSYTEPDVLWHQPYLRADTLTPTGSGFDITWKEVFTAGRYYSWLAIKGGLWKVGSSTTATNTSNFSLTGFGHQPKAIMFFSAARPESTEDAATVHWTSSIGAATGAGGNSAADRLHKRIQTMHYAHGVQFDEVYQNLDILTDSAIGLMHVVSLDSDGVTLNMSDADPQANFFGYVSVGQ